MTYDMVEKQDLKARFVKTQETNVDILKYNKQWCVVIVEWKNENLEVKRQLGWKENNCWRKEMNKVEHDVWNTGL